MKRRDGLALLAGLAAGGGAFAQGEPTALEKIRQRGTLIVGVYKDMPPFNNADGRGIDVDLAGAIAQAMGLKLSLLPFQAGEDMGDDLRNMVWRGHYLGFGPADVLLHVPVDRPLIQASPRVEIFAPYFRERVMIARDVAKVPKMDSFDDFKGQKIAVPGQTLAGWLLIGAESGRYAGQLTTKLNDGTDAARLLAAGEVVGAAGNASELESVLAGDARFVIEPLPVPRMREGWVVGCAVKKESKDLAQAVQAAVNALASTGELKAMFAKGKVSWRQP